MTNDKLFLDSIIRSYSYHSLLNCITLSDVVYKFVNFQWLRRRLFMEMYVNAK